MIMEPNLFMFDVMSALIPIFFMVVLGIILFTLIRSVGQWRHNNQQPVLSVTAKVVTKRTQVRGHHHHHADGQFHHHSHTSYYVTFEVESGDRLEFQVTGPEYGQLVEGDMGKLTFQGTRYHNFQRR